MMPFVQSWGHRVDAAGNTGRPPPITQAMLLDRAIHDLPESHLYRHATGVHERRERKSRAWDHRLAGDRRLLRFVAGVARIPSGRWPTPAIDTGQCPSKTAHASPKPQPPVATRALWRYVQRD